MPIISQGIVLDDYITDESYVVLLGEDTKPLYCVLHEIDPKSDKKKNIILGAFRAGDRYFLYSRISNIGTIGRITEKVYPTISKCGEEFKKKFKTLTENTWPGRTNYQIRNGVVLFSLGEPVDESHEELLDLPKLNLPESVIRFIDLIGSNDVLTQSLESLNIGDLSSGSCIREGGLYIPPDNIVEARSLLYRHCIEEDSDPIKITRIFYSLIPVMKSKITLIESEEDIKEKLDMLDTLESISHNISVINSGKVLSKESSYSKHEIIYSTLGYNITNPNQTEFNRLREYFYDSMGQHRFKLRLVNILKLEDPKRESVFLEKYGKDRRELMYHGSRLVNWMSILNKGLLINPNKLCDRITGKMYGNGIYWANSVSKSAQYCTSDSECQQIVLALADVALGREQRSTAGGTFDRTKYDSMFGVGSYSYESYEEFLPGLYIPKGKLKNVTTSQSLWYDEKIIYNEDRYLFRYIVIAEMN